METKNMGKLDLRSGSNVKLLPRNLFVFFWGLMIFLLQLPVANSLTDTRILPGIRNLSINEGLSQNFASSIHQDKFGFMWIGTKDGLNMYDGYSFKVFRHNPFNPNSISDNFIKTIYCDDKGRIWVGTLNGGLNLFDRETGNFIRFVHNPDDPNSISSNNVQAITSDNQGNIWIGTSGEGLNRIAFKMENLDSNTNDYLVTRFKDNISGYSIPDANITTLIRDREGLIWVASHNRILKISTKENESIIREVAVYFKESKDHSTNEINLPPSGNKIVFEDSDGEIWLLSSQGLFLYGSIQDSFQPYFSGFTSDVQPNPLAAISFMGKDGKELWLSYEQKLIIFDPNNRRYDEIFFDNQVRRSFWGPNIISLFTDATGAIWIGSNGYGLSVYDPNTVKFSYPEDKGYTLNGDFISSRDLSIRAMVMSDNRYLWIGANPGLFRIDRLNSVLEEIEFNINLEGELFSIISLQSGSDGNLWMGTNAGLIKFDPLKYSLQIYPTGLVDSIKYSEPRVSKVFFTQNGDLWVITPNTIALFDQKQGTFKHKRYNEEPLNRFKEAVFPTAYEDNSGNLWLGTHNGLHYFDVSSWTLKNYINDPSNPTSLPFNYVRSIIPDPAYPGKYLWVATGGGGIARLDIAKEKFLNYSENQGLSNNMVYGMLADKSGNFWLSTNHGLSKFLREERRFINYTVTDGLQSNEFNSGAFFQGPDGEMFFGGIKGYNCFFPEKIVNKSLSVPVVFTDFTFLTQSDEGLHLNISDRKSIDLGYNQNSFTISFASLDFANPYKNKFSYMFTTSGDSWIELRENRSITFIDLKPGSYILRVKGTNNDGEWSENEALLKIVVAKPWWGTNLSIIIYILIFLSVFWGVREYELARIKLKNQMKLSSLEANKLRDIDSMKSRFFANISHELRTPLTLIKGPVEELIDETKEPQKRKLLEIVQNNSINLQNLINQLLDLSKLESGLYKIRVSKGDIVSFIKGIVMSFASLASQRSINLRFIESSSLKKNESGLDFYFDRDAMEKILNNLLSNAFKFSPDNSKITVSVCLRKWKNHEQKLEIIIADTGIGISKDKIPFIYDRFFQVDDAINRKYVGTGIGLAYVKELIELHKGNISVMSHPDKGTTFKLRFSVGRDSYKEDQIVEFDDTIAAQIQHSPNKSNLTVKGLQDSIPSGISEEEKPIILIVEDHDDVRKYISYSLRKEYSLLEAADANEGIQIANETIPDLIICDVMMPGKDGFEFCKTMKQGERTSHIPLILLTARAHERDKIHGLESGADDYLVKPFSSTELKLRIANLIDNRRIIREKYQLSKVIKPGEVMVTSRDTKFMEQLLNYIEANISNENYSVDDLAAQMNMSHSQLHRKLKALINQSVIQFIKSVKLNRAKELLEKNAGNIGEVAFMVGFSDPGYFAKSFKAFFGILPSEIRKPNGT
jgi:signal transduction histidine kinase/ligand-binding sensor domain-containing protein/DNA-binding response OmpR family regulator